MQNDAGLDLRTLFWKTVPVALRRTDRIIEDQYVQLNVRLLAGYAQNTETLKLVKLYVSNEADLSFLYFLDLPEDRYGRIREEEQLLVDFTGFVDKLRWLFHQCCQRALVNERPEIDGDFGLTGKEVVCPPSSKQIQCSCNGACSTLTLGGDTTSPSLSNYKAVLHVSGSANGVLRLVELNAFKELPHLTLHLKFANEASINQYLIFITKELKRKCTSTSNLLEHAQRERDALQQEVITLHQAAERVGNDHQRVVGLHSAEIATLKQQLGESQELLQKNVSKVEELATTLTETENKLQKSQQQATELQRGQQETLCRLKETEKDLCEAQQKASIAQQEQLLAQQKAIGLETALAQANARIDELKAAAKDHDERIKASDQAVSTLQASLQAARSEQSRLERCLERTASGTADLETEIDRLKKEVLEATENSKQLHQHLKTKTTEAGAALEKCEEYKSKLDQLEEKLRGSERMVSWLNKQLTLAQLHQPPAGLGIIKEGNGLRSPFTGAPFTPTASTTVGNKPHKASSTSATTATNTLAGLNSTPSKPPQPRVPTYT